MPEQLRTSLKRRARKCANAVLNPLLGVLHSRLFHSRNVAMFHVGRVGSTVLASMLRQHRRIHWPGEVFEKEHSRYTMMVGTGSYTVSTDPLKILRSEMRAAGSRMFGFELKFLNEHHLKVIGLDLENCIDALSRLGFDQYIVLKRRNILRRLVSGFVLRKTGQSHVRMGQELVKVRCHLDLDRIPIGASFYNLVHAIKVIEEGHERLSCALAGENICELNYEDHISDDPLVAYHKLMTFFQLEPAEPKVLLRKTNPDPLEDMIENFDELCARLENTPYKWMLTSR